VEFVVGEEGVVVGDLVEGGGRWVGGGGDEGGEFAELVEVVEAAYDWVEEVDWLVCAGVEVGVEEVLAFVCERGEVGVVCGCGGVFCEADVEV